MASPASGLTTSAKRAAYGLGQFARIAWFTGHYVAGRRLMGPLTAPGEAPYADEFSSLDRERLKTSFRELFRNEWDNIKRGVYRMPRELRHAPSPGRLWRRSRDYFQDAAKVARRKHANGHSEVLSEDDRARYPRYFLQNFHYQTDGWLTAESADRYDMQVDTLFTGAAGAMRRIALPFISEALADRDMNETRFLDLATGTGVFLRDVMDNWPQLQATALDLSPAYLGKARSVLGAWPQIDYVQANAEATDQPSESFDVISCVYLFHELPPKARSAVAKEVARLLKPGGKFIQVDTIQYGDETGFDILLENFPRGFHEPYYDSYCREDLSELFRAAGLVCEDQTIGFLTKASVFRKPL